MTQQSGEKEEEATRIRAQYIDRVQKLNKVLQVRLLTRQQCVKHHYIFTS